MKTEKSKKNESKKQLQPKENKAIVKRMQINEAIKEKAFSYYAKGLTCKEVAKLLDL